MRAQRYFLSQINCYRLLTGRCYQCPVKCLFCDDVQRAAILAIHEEGKQYTRTFSSSQIGRTSAAELLSQNNLDEASLVKLESKWSIVWSREWKNRDNRTRRVLYQW